MCGFYGTTRLYKKEVLDKKLSLMNFRGPDHQEHKTFMFRGEQRITLGHVRLAIMDLDPRSNQPFEYNENITIAFNGEIYNFEELKRQYLQNVPLRTTCDTEVICAMYEKFGTKAIEYFNGMFAFVLFDNENNLLWGARDRLGKKPFYYWLSDEGLECASQLNPIAYGNNFTIDETARQFYLLHSYIADPYCIYKEVKKLRAGCQFTYSLDSKQMEISQYWDIHSNTCGFTAPKSYQEAKEAVKELLFDAVKIRLNADVPVGMFLSGGIDSSLTSAIISKLNKNITAYTIGFNDPKYDESQHAVDVAKALGIPIKVNFCEGSDMLAMFDNYVHYYDEPFADFSLIPTSLVASKASQDVKVVVGGDGGDELFLGYDKYQHIQKLEWFFHLPQAMRDVAATVYKQFADEHQAKKLKAHELKDMHRDFGAYCHYYGAENYDAHQVGSKLPDGDYLNSDRGVLAYSDYDMKMYMNSCVNTKTDRATMRSSIELRSPIMDYRLAEYSRVIPLEYLQSRNLGSKRILKDILYEMVPREILERPKQGFNAPLEGWFRGELRQEIQSVVTRENVSMLLPDLNAEKINTILYAFMEGANYDAKTIWSIYTYIKWYNEAKKTSK